MQQTKAKIAYLSARADVRLKNYLQNAGYKVESVGPLPGVDSAIACHPDLLYCSLGDRIYAGDPALLGPGYPKDVLYNAAAVGAYFICSKFTHPDLIRASERKPVLVTQGYVKCNLAVVDETHVITEDAGIAKVLARETDLICLKIEPGFVQLPGYKYGFIGGATGRCGGEMVFAGNLAAHPEFKKIEDFVTACGLKIRYFPEFPLTDVGSIVTMEKE